MKYACKLDRTSLGAYQEWVRAMWNYQDQVTEEAFQKDWDFRDDYIAATGLAGECGEVMELLKKGERDHTGIDKDKLTSELGDVLYYVTILACRYGIKMESVIDVNVDKIEGRKAIRKKLSKNNLLENK